jgi:hypothetical protein
MKKIFMIVLMISVQVFPQSGFGIEAGGGIDLISNSDLSSRNLDNGYSLTVSPIYYFNKTISVFGVFTFHRAEGALNNGGIVWADAEGYSIDNPTKPNSYAYEIALGLRANFSDKMVKPYFVVRTGFLLTNNAFFSGYYFGPSGLNSTIWDRKHKLALYISPGFGINFNLIKNLNFLFEARFNMTTVTDYSFVPVTTGIQYMF